ncbi:hypothetical protein T02_12400 [Trichinella nativa]|uniref:Uncharacterized protein n=1 Tax=Trichinella nativa TaxID=6335 RepID=A0A0V1KNZ3_9BILA|nr:hypothetical protein T02_12400 [Trichinella nativa]
MIERTKFIDRQDTQIQEWIIFYSKRPITLRHMDPDSTRPVVIDNGSGVDLQEVMHHLQSFHLSLAVHDTKVQ